MPIRVPLLFTLGAQFNINRIGLCQHKTSRLHRCSTGVSFCKQSTGTHIIFSVILTASNVKPILLEFQTLTLRISGIFCQSEALDRGKHLKDERIEEEKAPASSFGSPRKGQAINRLDTVSDPEKPSAVQTLPALKGHISGLLPFR